MLAALLLAGAAPSDWSVRGIAADAARDFDGADLAFDRAIALHAGEAVLHYDRGNARRHAARLAEAIADYDRALALRPDMAEALINRKRWFQATSAQGMSFAS
jgi:tetratricopeptide (TPR) repeat protein